MTKRLEARFAPSFSRDLKGKVERHKRNLDELRLSAGRQTNRLAAPALPIAMR